MNPRTEDGVNWTLTFTGENTPDNLMDIPGLRVGHGAATGLIDAVAVACMRLGMTLPKQRQSIRLVLPDTLRDYQKVGINQTVGTMKRVGGALLADDMGLGKTLQAITSIRVLGPRRTLVACPAAARETWRDELAKWGESNVAVLSPSPTKAARAEWANAPTARVVVTSYDLVPKAMELAFEDTLPQMVVMDEAHRLKGRKTQRSKALYEVANLADFKLALTGTPIWSRPRDFYQLLHILFGYRFGNQYDFDRAYCGGQVNEYGGWVNRGATRTDELKTRLSYYMVRREKHQVAAELPALMRTVRWVDPTPQAKKAFVASQLGFNKGNLHDALVATLNGKVDEALQVAAEARRFLLFTYLRQQARDMARALETEHDTPCVCITGDQSTEARAKLVRLAEQRGIGIVATIDAASEALNMQGVASVGIMHAIDWVPLKMAQAEARIHRIGSKDPVQWVYIAMRESVDEVIVHTVVEKLDQWRSIMGQNSKRELRDSLQDSSAMGEDAEKQVLHSIYEAMT